MREKIIEIVENAQVASIQDAHKFADQIIKLFREIVPEETKVIWDKDKDEICTIFGKCQSCGAYSVIDGSNYCYDCGRKIIKKF